MIKKFLSDSFLYTIAGLFTKGLAFFMLPIYVAYLTKTEYGIFDYILTIGSFLGICIGLEVAQSVIRFASENNNNKTQQFKYISNGLWFTLFSYLLLIFISLFFLDRLSFFLTENRDNKLLVLLALFTYLSTAMMYFINVAYRAQLKPKAATLSSAISALLVATLSILFIYVFNLGIAALLLSLILSQLIVVMFNVFKMRNMLFFSIDFSKLKDMLRFSTPLVISSLGVVLSTLVDRIMIKEILYFDDVAIYAVAARFASLLALLIIGFQSALAPLIYSNLMNISLKSDVKKLFYGYILISVAVILFLSLFSKLLVNFIVGIEYQDSAVLIPILASAVAVHSAYMFFPGLSIAKKTSILAFINILSGLFNILLNYLMIPKYGVIGAAYSTLISASLYFTMNAYFSEKYFCLFKK